MRRSPSFSLLVKEKEVKRKASPKPSPRPSSTPSTLFSKLGLARLVLRQRKKRTLHASDGLDGSGFRACDLYSWSRKLGPGRTKGKGLCCPDRSFGHVGTQMVVSTFIEIINQIGDDTKKKMSFRACREICISAFVRISIFLKVATLCIPRRKLSWSEMLYHFFIT